MISTLLSLFNLTITLFGTSYALTTLLLVVLFFTVLVLFLCSPPRVPRHATDNGTPVFGGVPTTKDFAKKRPDAASVKRGYKRNMPEGCDVAVVGSGVAGLTAAVALAKMGNKVVVLEQHDRVGGALHCFEEHGWEWDTGVHYIGAVSRPFDIPRLCFDMLTGGQVEWASCGDIVDVAHLGDNVVELRAGKEKFIEAYEKAYPGSRPAVERYVKACEDTRLGALDFMMDKMVAAMPLWKRIGYAVYRMFKPSRFPAVNRPLQEVLDEITDNKDLQTALIYNIGDYGEPPSKATFFVQAQLTLHYMGGSYYPIGGPSELPLYATKIIEDHGGKVLVRARVAEIVLDGDTAVGVRLDGEKSILHARSVISTAGYFNTFQQLIPKEVSVKHGYQKSMDALRESRASAHLSLFVGLEGDSEELDLPGYNLWVYPDNRIEENFDSSVQDDPLSKLGMFFISFPSAKDPEYKKRHPGKSVAEVLSLASYDFFEPFETANVKHRGNEYNSYKDKISKMMLDLLYSKFPKLKGKVKYHELGTPITTKYYLESYRGASYGLEHSPARYNDSKISSVTPIDGLYLSGQDTHSVGVTPSLISGIMTAAAVSGRDLFSEMIKERSKRKKDYFANKKKD